MKTKNIFLSIATAAVLLLTACNSKAQNTAKVTSSAANAKIEVLQFHSEHRCMTCKKIEVLAKETLQNHPSIPFTLINVDDEQNEQRAEEFEAYGTALFLYNPTTGEKKNLTEFAFMTAGNKDKFIKEFNREITAFSK